VEILEEKPQAIFGGAIMAYGMRDIGKLRKRGEGGGGTSQETARERGILGS